MAPKMVTSFRRSLSFPNPPSSHASIKPKKAFHVRSASLPCRSHPIISLLRDETSDLLAWSAADAADRSSAWLCDGLRRLKSVHESLDDLLHLPQTRDSLRGGEYSGLVEKLLEDFLRFVDVYGSFQTLLIRLKEEHSAAQIAVRRKDTARTATHSRSLSKIAKEIGKLSSNFASIGKSAAAAAAPPRAPYDDEAELVDVIVGVVGATAAVSRALFGGLSTSAAFRKQSCTGMSFGRKSKNSKVEGGILELQELNLENLRKKAEEEVKIASKKMQEMEDRILEIEECGERAFRSLINTRVSLLNVLTQ